MANVLMMESSVLERYYWGKILRGAGHVVFEAAEVGTATDHIVRNRIEVVVCSGQLAGAMLGELSWVAPWLPLVCVGSEVSAEAAARSAVVLDAPSPGELLTWVEAELLLQQAVA